MPLPEQDTLYDFEKEAFQAVEDFTIPNFKETDDRLRAIVTESVDKIFARLRNKINAYEQR